MTPHCPLSPPMPEARVCRKSRPTQLGRVIETGVVGSRVKWDSGATGYVHNAALRTVAPRI